jgi:hypothetical protein
VFEDLDIIVSGHRGRSGDRSRIDLLENRLNSVVCSICNTLVAVLTSIKVTKAEEKAVLFLLPEGNNYNDINLQEITLAGHSYHICHNYDEL